MRINKLLSNYGICSRKEAARLIEEKRVKVNGVLAIPGQWVEEIDEILVDNQLIKPKEKIYIALNKPVGITCTASDDVDNNIISYMNYPEYIFPVGRLDKESEGLILLTNDGDLANKIIDADSYHEKEYIVTLDKPYDEAFIKNMENGVEIQIKGSSNYTVSPGVTEVTRPCKVDRIDEITYRITLTQGLNKQIRKMSKALGYTVIKLQRIRIMNISMHGIEYGKWRLLTGNEVDTLRN